MDGDLDFWRETLWKAADSVGLKLTDDQLETMAADLVAADRRRHGETDGTLNRFRHSL